MQLFKTRYFHQWATAENLLDKHLIQATIELSQGLHDGNLGSFCYKKRIGVSGRSKRNGARLIIAFQIGIKAFFIYGYAKNKKANVNEKELAQYRKLANLFFNLSQHEIEKLLKLGELIEVTK